MGGGGIREADVGDVGGEGGGEEGEVEEEEDREMPAPRCQNTFYWLQHVTIFIIKVSELKQSRGHPFD